MASKIISIGCDHAGFPYKLAVINYLQSAGYTVKDFGTFSTDSVDYPDYVHPVAESIEKGEAQAGVLMCGSGNGVCMTANKHVHIRAALVWREEIASLARQHNNANIICIPARFISETDAIKFITIFLHTDFEGGRHERRVEKMSQFC